MSNIRKSLLEFTFSGANMQRWNDKLRPTHLVETDKQAHKMIIAFLLCHNSPCESEEERLDLFTEVIEGALFDYFYRLVITDLKPPLFYKIKENKKHFAQLTLHVKKVLEPLLSSFNTEFWERFCQYHSPSNKQKPQVKNILEASHLFASQWEFNTIKNFNFFDVEIEGIEKDFNVKLKNLCKKKGLESFKDILDKNSPLGKFAYFCGQLRFQVRWSQVPRIPETTVLGHLYIVACFAYFVSIDIGACEARKINNFFCGLFHDLPELLTKDIISPVKNSSHQLPKFIKEYEDKEIENRIFKPLNNEYPHIVSALSALLGIGCGGEFTETYCNGNKQTTVDFKTLHSQYNSNCFSPKDGAFIKACDILAAFIEAYTSVKNNVSAHHLLVAMERMRRNMPNPDPKLINFLSLLADFD